MQVLFLTVNCMWYQLLFERSVLKVSFLACANIPPVLVRILISELLLFASTLMSTSILKSSSWSILVYAVDVLVGCIVV